jgi:hypothetical protein
VVGAGVCPRCSYMRRKLKHDLISSSSRGKVTMCAAGEDTDAAAILHPLWHRSHKTENGNRLTYFANKVDLKL